VIVPTSPPGVSVEENMAVAFHKKKVLKEGSAFIYSWQEWIKKGVRYARFRNY
jgi:hypothetical protein